MIPFPLQAQQGYNLSKWLCSTQRIQKAQGKAFIDVQNGINSAPGLLAIQQKLISKHKRIKPV